MPAAAKPCELERRTFDSGRVLTFGPIATSGSCGVQGGTAAGPLGGLRWLQRGSDAEPQRDANQFRQGIGCHLVHDLGAVNLNRFLGHP
jgi:hypothetical protein